MEFNPLPAGYDGVKLGPQKRRIEFKSSEAKLACDAANLVRIAKEQSDRLDIQVDPIALARRKDDDIKALQAAIKREQEVVIWLGEFQTRFNALSKLHEGIKWTDVEKSLRADPESMRRLRALDEKGHEMNVFGEEGDEFIFVSAWNEYEQVALDHRNIAYDPAGQRSAEKLRGQPNSNAVSILAGIMCVEENEADNYLADPKFNEQLRRVIAVKGWAWLKTDAATRRTGEAFFGSYNGFYGYYAYNHDDSGSFRAELRVKNANGFLKPKMTTISPGGEISG